jgi:hypothetical protein
MVTYRVEEIPVGARGFGRYKYRVIGSDDVATHHTNSHDDACSWRDSCNDIKNKQTHTTQS